MLYGAVTPEGQIKGPRHARDTRRGAVHASQAGRARDAQNWSGGALLAAAARRWVAMTHHRDGSNARRFQNR